MIWLFSLICYLFIVSIQCEEENSNLQTIYFHIGPHKTGTSHFQSFAHENRKLLQKENLCWPNDQKPKTFSSWSSEIVETGYSKEFAHLAQKCLNKNMNLLISGESYSAFTPEQIQKLKSFLINIYQDRKVTIKIILSYREWFREAISRYGQVAKRNGKIRNANNFIEYAFFSGITFRTLYQDMIEGYMSAFGSENIIIIDYYGMEADKIDITEVILCEIAHVYCGRMNELEPDHDANEHLDPIYENFVFILDDYLNAKKLKQCSLDDKYQKTYLAYLAQKKMKFPVLSSKLEIFQSERFRLNNEMYKNYGHLMLHANKTYNEMKILTHVFEELDVNSLYQDEEWEAFMLSEQNRLMKAGKICDLSTGKVVKVVTPVESVPAPAPAPAPTDSKPFLSFIKKTLSPVSSPTRAVQDIGDKTTHEMKDKKHSHKESSKHRENTHPL